MLIECRIKRAGEDQTTRINLNGRRYTFEPNAAGHCVAEVIPKDHAAHFLADCDFRHYEPGPDTRPVGDDNPDALSD